MTPEEQYMHDAVVKFVDVVFSLPFAPQGLILAVVLAILSWALSLSGGATDEVSE
jgi:hypothetical protein